MSRVTDFGNRLYRGDVALNIVGNRRRWYALSALLFLLCVLALVVRGLNFGVEFTGGSVVTVPTQGCGVQTARDAFASAGVTAEEPIVTEVSGTQGRSIRVQTVTLTPDDSQAVSQAIADACGVSSDQASIQTIGPSWGKAITNKAVTGLIMFLAAIVIYLSVAFEWRMAIAALVALAHDVFITVGIFALVGFEVTPASVIGLLTILGYSLYDTVVVFDKVKENTRGLSAGSRMTYTEAANLAVNQTLVRSINTSIVGLLPVAALLFVGAYVLGAGTLKDLALALFVGIAVGTYSSIFIATPVLADLKEREPAMQALRSRVLARRASRPGTAADLRSGTGATAAPAPAGVAASSAEVTTAPTAAKPPARPTRAAAGGQRSQPRRGTAKKRKR